MGDAKVKLVFLDACRDNPFAAKIKSNSATRSVNVGSGLAEMKSGEGTLIAFATGPGQTALDGTEGGNSPFTRALLKHIDTRGITIQELMIRVRKSVMEETKNQQIPWEEAALNEGFSFVEGSTFAPNTGAIRPAAPQGNPVARPAQPAPARPATGTGF